LNLRRVLDSAVAYIFDQNRVGPLLEPIRGRRDYWHWVALAVTDPSRESIEPWPLRHVQTALWFLAASPTEKATYLPAPFPGIMFHGAEGDFGTGNPLYFMVAFCGDACRVGARIDEWMDLDPTGKIGNQFRELEAILAQMRWERLRQSESPFRDFVTGYPDMAALLDATNRYANAIIADLGWSADLPYPRLTCAGLLDEYSYGAYSAPEAQQLDADTK